MELRESANGWNEYEKLVLTKLDDHNTQLQALDTKISAIHIELAMLKVEIAMLKVKSGVWGGLAGVVTVLLALGLKLITGH